MRFVTISGSLDPDSRSRRLARLADRMLVDAGHETMLIDLRAVELPPFDNARAFDHPSYQLLHDAIAGADGVILAAPVYNWGLGSAVKNLIELTGATIEGGRQSAWFDKVVTFLCAGGLPQAHMAFLPVANGLMLDFKCIINPHIVYATEPDWAGSAPSGGLSARLERAVDRHLDLSAALRGRPTRSGWTI